MIDDSRKDKEEEMATRCDVKGCPYFAVEGEKQCLVHKPRPAPRSPTAEADGFAFVSMSEVPTNARYNEAAGKLFAAIKVAQAGHALKVSMKIFKKITLQTAKRYALAGGLRIGVRIVGESGYLWKLNETEIKAIGLKADRMIKAREKNKGKKARTAGT